MLLPAHRFPLPERPTNSFIISYMACRGLSLIEKALVIHSQFNVLSAEERTETFRTEFRMKRRMFEKCQAFLKENENVEKKIKGSD